MAPITHVTLPESFLVMQDLVRLHARYEQTDGGFFVMEVKVAPGGGPPPLHTHPAHEFFWTLEGRLSFFRDDGPDGLTEITGGPGTSAFIPGGVAHTYRNFSDEPASYLGVLSPPELMQDFLLEAGVAPGGELRGPEEVLAIGERFGLVILDAVPEPALSQQIRALEDQVGLPLFVRHPRGMELTEAGEVLLQEARALLGGSDRLEATVEELRRGRTASLRVGLPPGLPQALLPEMLASLCAKQPDARVEVRELTTPEQLSAVHEGALDLALVREPVDDKRLARRTLLIEPLGVSLPVGHPLAGHSSLTLRQLQDELFVCFPRPWAPSLHDVLVSELREQGIQARFQESAHLSTTVGMVAAGDGLTLSAPAWLDGIAGIVWRPLSDVRIEIRTAAAWRAANRSPLLRTLVGLLPAAADAHASPAPDAKRSGATPR